MDASPPDSPTNPPPADRPSTDPPPPDRPSTDAPVEPPAGPRRRSGILLLFGAILLVGGFLVAPQLPKDQTVHVVLGNGAARVKELQIRYFGPLPTDVAHGAGAAGRSAAPSATAGYFAREATFRYGQDVHAPRIVDHAPRLVDGDYLVEVSLVTDHGNGPVQPVQRYVHLSGERTTSIDVVTALEAR
ncbi:hypothetical protein [Pendulispora albinea]|uniref:Uncharacterized protein n=1 Tax=Pendulispora albinea TaxID=2741071 RepID=A0ABZ2MAY4_9BACT